MLVLTRSTHVYGGTNEPTHPRDRPQNCCWNHRSIESGQTAVDLDAAQTGGPPFFLIPIQFALHAIALVAAYGAWRGQRWGVVLLIVLSVLNIIPGLLGALFAPSPGTRIYAVVSVILDILIIVLCLWRERKSAGQVAHVS
jgi:hypothetical protein